MAVYGKGALAGWFDYSGPEDMNEWQAREHIGERVAIPGFIRGRRFEAPDAEPAYFMFYETVDVSAFAGEEYLSRLNNPTDWSRRCAGGLANMRRSLCRITATVGAIDGGAIATIQLSPGGGDAEALRTWISAGLLPELVGMPGMFAAHLLETDEQLSRIETVEKQLRGSQDDLADWAILVEGRQPESLVTALAGMPERLAAQGAIAVRMPQGYRLSFAAQRTLT